MTTIHTTAAVRARFKPMLSGLLVLPLISGCVTMGSDKVMHVSATGIISFVATCLADKDTALAAGAGTGMGAGLAKEVYDSRPGGTGFSGEDLLADAAGTGLGTALGYGLCHGRKAPASGASDSVAQNDGAASAGN
ncbi:MAG TPA: hypothetical protein ENJ68_00295 [Devosia sp.]|nr:hypothetical protein [Devosia sp.]